MSVPRNGASTRQLRLSEELVGLIDHFAERRVTLREVVGVLHGRAYTLLLVLLALPFCTPIPMPGFSIPFGLVIAVIGFRLSLRQKPWLPARLLDTALPPRFFRRVLRGTRLIIRAMEWGLRPRLTFLVDPPVLHHLYGLLILIAGILLLLPLPIPLSNTFPAWVVVLTAAALMERDGICALAAGLMFLANIAFFGLLLWGGIEAMEWLGRQVAVASLT